MIGLVWFDIIAYQRLKAIKCEIILYMFTKYIISTHLVDIIFKRAELIFLTRFNGFTYFYLIQIILSDIDHLFALS